MSPSGTVGTPAGADTGEFTISDPRVQAALDRAADVRTVDVTECASIFDDVYLRLQAALSRPEAT